MTIDKLIKNSLIQTAITFSSIFLIGLFTSISYVSYEILPFIVMFSMFNIAYKWKNKILQTVSISLFAIAYLLMALFFTIIFIDNAVITLVSACLIAYYHVKYTNGGKIDYQTALIPAIVTFIQIIAFIIITDSESDSYFRRTQFAENMDQIKGLSLFLAISLITNYTTAIFGKWWIPILVGAGTLLIINTLYSNLNLLSLVIPKKYFLIYIGGVTLTVITNKVLNNKNHKSTWSSLTQLPNHILEKEIPSKVWILSLSQCAIIFLHNITDYFMPSITDVDLYKHTTATCVFTLLLFIFNLASYDRDIKKQAKIILAIFLVYVITLIYTLYPYYLITTGIILFLMLVFSYCFFSNKSIK